MEQVEIAPGVAGGSLTFQSPIGCTDSKAGEPREDSVKDVAPFMCKCEVSCDSGGEGRMRLRLEPYQTFPSEYPSLFCVRACMRHAPGLCIGSPRRTVGTLFLEEFLRDSINTKQIPTTKQ